MIRRATTAPRVSECVHRLLRRKKAARCLPRCTFPRMWSRRGDPNFHPEHIDAERRGHTWLALSVAQHGAATFDAWTTRRAISQGHVELNPMLRPFAGNASIYGAVQVAPSILDFVGRRMQRSENRWMRQMWWLPQTLGTAASVFAGARNLSVTQVAPDCPELQRALLFARASNRLASWRRKFR